MLYGQTCKHQPCKLKKKIRVNDMYLRIYPGPCTPSLKQTLFLPSFLLFVCCCCCCCCYISSMLFLVSLKNDSKPLAQVFLSLVYPENVFITFRCISTNNFPSFLAVQAWKSDYAPARNDVSKSTNSYTQCNLLWHSCDAERNSTTLSSVTKT